MLRDLVLKTPPNVVEGGWLAALAGAAQGRARSAGGCRRLDITARRDLLALFAQSAGDWLDGWFESDPIKAAFGFDGVVGNYASPYTPGIGLCAAAPRVRRGERQEGRLGPRHRRHGRDHPGHGRGLRARRASTSAPTRAVARGDRREGPRRRRRHRGRRDASRAATVVSNLNPKLLFEQAGRSGRAAGRFPRAHRALPLRLGHLPHERGAVGAAALHLPAGGGRPPDRRHHHRAQPRPTWTAPIADARATGWSKAADRRDADPLDPRRQPGAARASTSPACSASTSRRSCPDGRSWDDHREEVADLMIDTVDALRAGLQGLGARPPGADAARPGAHLRPRRRRHHARRAEPRSAVLRPAGARPRRLPRADRRASTCAAPAPTPAAASPARPATTPRARS